MKVLLVDTDHELLSITAFALRREGFEVITALDGVGALQRWQEEHPTIVVLETELPGVNGFEVCRIIRQSGPTGVILLTALRSDEHLVHGFQLGADDYVTKPFSPRQLAMRIRAVGRRMQGTKARVPARELQVGELVLNIDSHELRLGDKVVQLTPIEFRLLQQLASNPGRVTSRTRLADCAWGYGEGGEEVLKVHMSRIRKKLALFGCRTLDITAVSGVGYRLEAPTQRAL